jgi:hypothetical protein
MMMVCHWYPVIERASSDLRRWDMIPALPLVPLAR